VDAAIHSGSDAMIRCHLVDGVFSDNEYPDFEDIASIVHKNRKILADIPIEAIIKILDLLGKKVLHNTSLNAFQGISYISLWLRRENLDKICKINFSDKKYLDGFQKTHKNFLMTAQPRGIVCQWIAANMPTLGFFSMVQVILSKNGSIVKMPEEYAPLLLSVLRDLPGISLEYEGNTYTGESILRSTAVVTFPGKDTVASTDFSRAADCRIIYGGSDAVRAISRLPTRDHCETIIFGPKYSFGVFDREFIESSGCKKSLDRFAKDVVLFNQQACSSPHVLFLEKSRYPAVEIAAWLGESFGKLPQGFLSQEISTGTSAAIINARARYLLSDDKNCISSQNLGWTILVDQEIRLEDPVQGRCIFIKEVNTLDEIIPMVNHKIQAISIGILDESKRERFARDATYRGADRIVPPGTIHDFDLPWDGIMTLNRLVRWVILKPD
jgi:hypothetical protein